MVRIGKEKKKRGIRGGTRVEKKTVKQRRRERMRDRGRNDPSPLGVRGHEGSVWPILTPILTPILCTASGEEASPSTSPGRNASPRGNKHHTKNGTMWVLGRKSAERAHTHTHNSLPFPSFLPTVCYRHPACFYFSNSLLPPLWFLILVAPFIPSSSPIPFSSIHRYSTIHILFVLVTPLT